MSEALSTFVVAVDQFLGEHIEAIAGAAEGWARVVRLPQSSPEPVWSSVLADAIGVVGWPPPAVLREHDVGLVVCGSTGVDAYLGRRLHESTGLHFCSAKGTMAIPMAEHALMQLLACSRHLAHHVEQRRVRLFEQLSPDCYVEVNGQTAVIVGFGDIGAAIGERCKAFGMRVIGVRRSPAPAPGADAVVGIESLAEAAGQADHLFLTVPGGPATARLLDAELLSRTKAKAIVYNLSRGTVVDEPALLAAIRSGRIAGAALDVFEDEPLDEHSPWWDEPRVLITPHIAGRSRQLADRLCDLVVRNITAFRTGAPLTNEVNLMNGAMA